MKDVSSLYLVKFAEQNYSQKLGGGGDINISPWQKNFSYFLFPAQTSKASLSPGGSSHDGCVSG